MRHRAAVRMAHRPLAPLNARVANLLAAKGEKPKVASDFIPTWEDEVQHVRLKPSEMFA